MFSLFICVTQDGWMGITEELQVGHMRCHSIVSYFLPPPLLQERIIIFQRLLRPFPPPSLPCLSLQQCGNYVLGAIYLLVFITIGAFIFANLVVAVVVTNLVRREKLYVRKGRVKYRLIPSFSSLVVCKTELGSLSGNEGKVEGVH